MLRGLPDLPEQDRSGWEGVPDLPKRDFCFWQKFWQKFCSHNLGISSSLINTAQAIRQTIKICEKSKVRIIILNFPFYLLNFFIAPFHLNGIQIYLSTTSLTAGTQKIWKSGTTWLIRQPADQNQAAAWLIRHLPDQNQAAACLIWSKSGGCQIKIRCCLMKQADAWFQSGRCRIEIRQVADWSGGWQIKTRIIREWW